MLEEWRYYDTKLKYWLCSDTAKYWKFIVHVIYVYVFNTGSVSNRGNWFKKRHCCHYCHIFFCFFLLHITISHLQMIPSLISNSRNSCSTIRRRTVGPNEISCFKKSYSLEISTDFDAFFFFLMKVNEICNNFIKPNFLFLLPFFTKLNIKWLDLEDLQSNGIEITYLISHLI